MQINFSDELVWAGNGGASNRERPLLWLQQGEAVVRFTGDSIPGTVRVLRNDYVKNGKWSHSKWTLQLAGDVTAWVLAGGDMREYAREGEKPRVIAYRKALTWSDIPADLHRIFRVIATKTSARLDEADKPV
jgi:hypothetical protein